MEWDVQAPRSRDSTTANHARREFLIGKPFLLRNRARPLYHVPYAEEITISEVSDGDFVKIWFYNGRRLICLKIGTCPCGAKIDVARSMFCNSECREQHESKEVAVLGRVVAKLSPLEKAKLIAILTRGDK